MAGPPKIRVPGSRGGTPGGYIIGRLKGSKGDPQLLDLVRLRQFGIGQPLAGSFATSAEVTAGHATLKSISPDALRGSEYGERGFQVFLTDPLAALVVGTGQYYIAIPHLLDGWNLVAVQADVVTVSTSGKPTFQVTRIRAGVTAAMLSTLLSIDANENSSADAAIPPVINTSNDDVLIKDQLRLDVTVAGTGAAGAMLTLIFQKP